MGYLFKQNKGLYFTFIYRQKKWKTNSNPIWTVQKKLKQNLIKIQIQQNVDYFQRNTGY